MSRWDEIIAQIERAGGKLRRRGEHEPGQPYAYVHDPDGYLIEIGITAWGDVSTS